MPNRLFRFSLAALVLTTAPATVWAEDASLWTTNAHSQVRLIAGTNSADQPSLRAGIEIKLAPGWITYWRYPGDAGVPPQFDFAGSENVKAVRVLWPAPVRISEAGGNSIGYRDRVVLPLRVKPKNAGLPVKLHVRLAYAVCENLCVPAKAEAQLVLATAKSIADPELRAAESRVPQPVAIGTDGALSVVAVRRIDGTPLPRVVVDVVAPKDAAVDLFAEGPTPDWALPLPTQEASATTNHRTFSFALDGLPPGAKADGAELTLTVTAGARAIEVKTRLD